MTSLTPNVDRWWKLRRIEWPQEFKKMHQIRGYLFASYLKENKYPLLYQLIAFDCWNLQRLFFFIANDIAYT